MNVDFQWYQFALIIIVFIWSGFVRAGFGFGGALFTIPFLLLIHDDPLFFLPIISIHLLFFAGLTLFYLSANCCVRRTVLRYPKQPLTGALFAMPC